MISNFHAKMLFGVLTLVLLCQCTEEKQKSKRVLDLEKSYAAAQEQLAGFDAKIKAAAGDEGLQIQYAHDKELAKSRVERLKAQLEKLSPESLKNEAAAGAAGGGHGGGH